MNELQQANEDSIKRQEPVEVVQDSTCIFVSVEIPQVDAET